MGNSDSKPKQCPAVERAYNSLGEEKLARCTQLFAKVAGATSELDAATFRDAFLSCLPSWSMRNILHDVHRYKRENKKATMESRPEHLVPRPVHSLTELAQQAAKTGDEYFHPSHDPDATITHSDMAIMASCSTAIDIQIRRLLYFSSTTPEFDKPAFTRDVYELIFCVLQIEPDDPNRARLIPLLNQAAFKGKFSADDAPKELCFDDFERLLDGLPMVESAFNEVFSIAWFFKDGLSAPDNLVPLSFGPESVYDASRLLDKFSVGAIDAKLGSMSGEWNLLYSSKLHGGSFATLRGKILDAGPSVVVVKDSNDYIFGGFAADSWKANPGFYGCDQCFVFKLQPELMIFPVSGKNKNYQYFNHGMEQLPNGLGMGGQLEYFGFFISDSYDRGHSKGHPLSTTYSSVVLSKTAEFNVAEMEVWRVGPLPAPDSDEEGDGNHHSSILHGNKEDKLLLKLAGMTMKSEGIIEEPLEEVVIDPKTGKAKRPVY